MGKPNAVLLLKRYFAAYEAVSIDVYGVETERGSGEAQRTVHRRDEGPRAQAAGARRLPAP